MGPSLEREASLHFDPNQRVQHVHDFLLPKGLPATPNKLTPTVVISDEPFTKHKPKPVCPWLVTVGPRPGALKPSKTIKSATGSFTSSWLVAMWMDKCCHKGSESAGDAQLTLDNLMMAQLTIFMISMIGDDWL